MTTDLSKHPESYAWGRNGSFIPAIAYADGYPASTAIDMPHVYLEVVSSKPGKTPPIKLRITRDDAIKLATALLVAAKEASV